MLALPCPAHAAHRQAHAVRANEHPQSEESTGVFDRKDPGCCPPRPRSVRVNRHLAVRVGGGEGVRRRKRFRYMRTGFLQQTDMEFASDGCLDQALLRNSLGRTTIPATVTIIGNLAADMRSIGGVSFAAAGGIFVIRDFCYMTSVNVVMHDKSL